MIVHPSPMPLDETVVRAVSLALEELVARLVTAREEVRNEQASGRRLRFAGWELDLYRRRLVAPGGGVVPLPGLEYALLQAFVAHPGQVLSRAELVQLTRRAGSVYPSERTISVYVSRLRRRLGASGSVSLIDTVWNQGYVFDADVARS